MGAPSESTRIPHRELTISIPNNANANTANEVAAEGMIKSDMEDLIQLAYVSNRLREPVLRSAIRALQLPSGSRGLDVGCGIGLQALLLAEAVGPGGHVTGLDLSPGSLLYANDIVRQAGLQDRISFQEGDANNLPFDDDTFDWAWSVDCVGYAPMPPVPLIKELVRVVKPGGQVAILAWSSEKLLPGHPILEARLGATPAGIAPFAKGQEPATHFLKALGWFHDVGLKDVAASTFVGDAFAPLPDDIYCALKALFAMRWPHVRQELTDTDWAEYERLCLEESPDFILQSAEYYAFFTYSMFQGKVVEYDQ